MPFAALGWVVAVLALPSLRCGLSATPPETRPEPVPVTVPAPAAAPPILRPDVSASLPKRELAQDRVSPAEPPPPPARVVHLPDEVVVKLLDGGQPAFLRCWVRAQRADPALISAKVSVHVELDAEGKVTTLTNDAELATFANCVAFVAAHLQFPAAGQPAVVDFPLLFR